MLIMRINANSRIANDANLESSEFAISVIRIYLRICLTPMTLTKTMQALSDPTRRKILELLKKKDMAAGEIGKYFKITLPSLSHHLNILKNADLVTSQRARQEIIYSLNLSVFEEVAKSLVKFFRK